MSNINNILQELPDGRDITINYYENPTINHYVLENTSRLPGYNNYGDHIPEIPDLDIPLPTNPSVSTPPHLSSSPTTEYTVNITNETGNPNEMIAEINATVDYSSGLDRINQVINLTDVLTHSIANSLDNIDAVHRLSLGDILSKTKIIIYRDIDNSEDKCHICNEGYNEFDICRSNNLCGHYFHQTCIDHWYSSNTKCPICQQVI